MSGKPSPAVIEAVELIKGGSHTPYAAAKAVNIALSTIYRSTLYRAWKAGGGVVKATRKRTRTL